MAKMWWRVSLMLLGLVIVIGVGVSFWRYRQPLPMLVPVVQALPSLPAATPNITWPSAPEAAVGAEGFGLLATNGTPTARPTASVAKIITALVVLNKYPLKLGEQGPTLTFDTTDVNFYNQYAAENGSVVKIEAGEQLTEYQTLEAMLLPSANNMADSLARWAYGSLSSYSVAANQLIKNWGLAQTTVGPDASGFDPGTVSTAGDLVRLGLMTMQNTSLKQIVSQTQATLPIGTVATTNTLLGLGGIIGIKTGNTDQAGGVFLGASQQTVGGHIVTIVSAVVGTANLVDALSQSTALLASTTPNFISTAIVNSNVVVGAYRLPWGGSAPAIIQKNLNLVVWKDTPVLPSIMLRNLRAPLNANSIVGLVSASSGGMTVSSPIIIEQPIPVPSLWWRIFR